MTSIKLKRGLKTNLPVLNVGEPAFTTDTKQIYVGDGTTNIELAKQSDLTTANNNIGLKANNSEISELLQGSRNINLVNGGQLTWGVTANTFTWSKVMSIFPAGGKLLQGGVSIKSINIAVGSAVLTNANDCMYITIPTTDGVTATVTVGQYNTITGNDKLIIAIRDSDSCLELLGGGWLVYGDTVTAGGARNVYINKSIVTTANDFIVGTANARVAKKSLAETKTILGISNVTNESKATMFTNPTFTGNVSATTFTGALSGNATSATNADTVDNCHVGNASGNVPISNGTANTNLNADMLDGYHAVDLVNRYGYSEQNTGASYAGQYTKITSVTLTAQYTEGNCILLFDSSGNGGSTNTNGMLSFRVKQQGALGTAPNLDLKLWNNQNINTSNFFAVTTVNTTSVTTVELWYKAWTSYDAIIFNPIIQNGTITFYSNQGYSTTLPTGTVTNCSQLDWNGNLNVNGTVTSSGTIQGSQLKSTIANGTAPLTVTSQTVVANLNADMVDGCQVSQTVGSANTIVARDSNGYINNTWFNSSRGDETTVASSYLYDTGDGYMRKKSLANARTELVTTPFGLGGLAIDISSQDCNSIVKTGYYRGSNCANRCPGSHTWTYLFVMGHDTGSWIMQIGVNYNGDGTYSRTKTNGTWTAWRRLDATATSQITNDSGFITSSSIPTSLPASSASSSVITTGLGYTPYNATNPSGFITSSASITGNSATATKLATARTIALTGGVTGSATFDGSSNSSITTTVTNNGHSHSSSTITDANNATGGIPVSNGTVNTNLNADMIDGYHATTSSTANTIAVSDANNNISASKFTGALNGNANTATKLATARNIALTGSVTGNVNFDGSGNISITTSTNHTHSSIDYISITGLTVDLNSYTLSDGSSESLFYRCTTTGGSTSITNKPVGDNPFSLEIRNIRFASSTDYITKQIFESINGVKYERFCVNGTWGEWNSIYATNNKPTPTDIGLGNVNNTSDLNKPVSTATQTALNGKANSSHTHTSANITDANNATGGIPVSNGTVNVNLNADMLDGYHATTASTANTIAVSDANNNISASKFTGALNGNANTATTSSFVSSPDGDRSNTVLPTTNPRSVKYAFGNGAVLGGTVGNYAGIMTYSPWDGTTASTGDCSYQLAFASTVANGGIPRLSIRNGIDSTWNSWNEVYHSGNLPISKGAGDYSIAEGNNTTASGTNSHAEGYNATAKGSFSHAEGYSTTASGTESHSEGYKTTASGSESHSEGSSTVASGGASHAEGNNTDAVGISSHAEGYSTTASGHSSHAEGIYTNASPGTIFNITGYNNTNKTITLDSVTGLLVGDLLDIVLLDYSNYLQMPITAISGLVLTINTIMTLDSTCKYAIKRSTSLSATHAEGSNTLASGNYSHAEGYRTLASGNSSHAEGSNTLTSGNYSHAEGQNAIASGQSSHAESYYTTASGNFSHSEGGNTRASNTYSHAEGYSTTASGYSSHAEGYYNTASGQYSHAEGSYNTASGQYSHAEGYYNTAKYAQHAMGQYGTLSTTTDTAYLATGEAFMIGNGTSPSLRGLAFKVMFNGLTYADGAYASTGADYAEYFEWLDGNIDNEDRVGYFVTIDEDKIRKANSSDDYILGIISATPSVVGDNYESWQSKYITDEFNRIQYHDVTIPETYKIISHEAVYETIIIEEVLDDEGNIITPYSEEKVLVKEAYEEQVIEQEERVEVHPIYNPEWDSSKEYITREHRQEWSPVGMMGKLLVRDDGTCKVNSYCKSNDDGVATACDLNEVVKFRVIKRVSENIVLVIIK